VLFEHDLEPTARAFLSELRQARRAARVDVTPSISAWIAAERLPELKAIHPGAMVEAGIEAPPSRAARVWSREDAVRELLRGRLTITGPVTGLALAASLGLTGADTEGGLLALESEGVILRGRFTAGLAELEWCDRSLLARIHRYTLTRLRAEIEPVSATDFMRFLIRWQHVEPATRLVGLDGLREVLSALDGVELPAGAWESHVLASRIEGYDPSLLDMLCLSGEVAWARLSPPSRMVDGGPPQLSGATPISIFLREHHSAWQQDCGDEGAPPRAARYGGQAATSSQLWSSADHPS
jgi:ATP-dependent Lhr-like helicase